MEYQKVYFDNDFIQKNIENLNWINIKNENLEISTIIDNND